MGRLKIVSGEIGLEIGLKLGYSGMGVDVLEVWRMGRGWCGIKWVRFFENKY